ncbi:MAG: relaxase [Pseudomonadota bacterium]
MLKEENEQVTIHDIRGFASEDLKAALNEAYAVSRGTRCKQFLFSLSLNPPAEENVRTEVFEETVARIEQKLGLTGQARALVWHEKEGRRHMHGVWSRIDVDEMKAIPLPYSKLKLMEISRELYLENGWKMPRGMMSSKERDPKNFTLAEWQQAKRAGKDAGEIKAALQDCWAVSDNKAAYIQALKERGFVLARGNRRNFIALNQQGAPFAVAKWTGIRTKEVRSRLGPEAELPTIEEARRQIAQEISPVIQCLQREQKEKAAKSETQRRERIGQMAKNHAQSRESLQTALLERETAERAQRQERFNKGLRGLVDHLTGRRAKIQRQNELDALNALQRDRQEKDDLVFRQLEERRTLKGELLAERERVAKASAELKEDRLAYKDMDKRVDDMRAEFQRVQSNIEQSAERGPSLNSKDIDLER